MSALRKKKLLCRLIVVAVSLFSSLMRDDVVFVKAIISELSIPRAFVNDLLLKILNDVLL